MTQPRNLEDLALYDALIAAGVDCYVSASGDVTDPAGMLVVDGGTVFWDEVDLGEATTPQEAARVVVEALRAAPARTGPPASELKSAPAEPAPWRSDPNTLAWHKALYEALRAEGFAVQWADCPGGSPGGEVRWVEFDNPVVERWLAGGHPPRSLGWAVWTGTRNLTPRPAWTVAEVVDLCKADRAERGPR